MRAAISTGIEAVSYTHLAPFIKKKVGLEAGIKFTSKKILQYAVILLGFGMNLRIVFETGKQSLPIIICTITTSLVIAYVLHRAMHIPVSYTHLDVYKRQPANHIRRQSNL